jgi:SAM-dependent methyltransferase
MPKHGADGQLNPAFDFSQAISVRPYRNPLQRLVNRLGRPFGVLPFPVAVESVLEYAGDRGSVFREIYEKNFWGSSESGSGPGSELRRTEHYRNELLEFLRRQEIRSMFDAPCGDLNWMSLVLDQWPMEYYGGDISEEAVSRARERRSNVRVQKFDICIDSFPETQLWHCRDSLFHLSFEDIWLALENVAKSNTEFALITTNKTRLMKNPDIDTGGFRYLDLERAPFNLPRALEYLKDAADDNFPRAVGLWRVSAIADAVRRGNDSKSPQ